MLRALVLAALLLAGCASAPLPTHTVPSSATTTTPVTPPAPKLPPPPPPQVGTCDVVVTSAGTGTGAVRYGQCLVSQALPALSADARSLLVEVTWDSLPATVLALRSTLENYAACPPPPALPSACSEMAVNASMVSPVRLVVEGEAFAKYGRDLTAFENAYTGAAVQQSFKLTFSAFAEERVPRNYTALR